MLNITDKALKSFSNPHSEKKFILQINLEDDKKFYSENNISISNPNTNDFVFFKGTIQNQLNFSSGYDFKSNKARSSNISVNSIDDINLFELSKSIELNLSETFLYFTTSDLNLNEAIPIYHGVVNISQIGLLNDPFTFNILSLNFKFDKVFPLTKIDSSLSWVDARNDAEKYLGEAIPIIYGFIEFPGLPVPLFYDDGSTRKYAVCNHNISSATDFNVYADGVLVSSSMYTKTYDSTNNIYYIQATGSNYTTYFQGKKITVVARGLLGSTDNPNPGEVVNDLLINYSNLDLEYIDSSDILFNGSLLNNYKVARFFNSDSTVFETINELTSEFPFVFVDRGFKKSIISVDPVVKNYTYKLIKGSNAFDRNRSIRISSNNELFNTFGIRYKYDALNNRWLGFDQIDKSNNSLCLKSFNRIKINKDKNILDAYSVSNVITASNILNFMANIFTRSYYIFVYNCTHEVINLEVGDGVKVIDNDLGIVNKNFMIIDKSVNKDFVTLAIKNTETL